MVDQGYSFKSITKLEGIENITNLAYKNLDSPLDLLNTVLITNDSFADETEKDLFSEDVDEEADELVVVKRKSCIKSLTGVDSMAYLEVASSQRERQKAKRVRRKKIVMGK